LILQDEPVATRIHSRSELQSAPARQHMQTIATAQRRVETELARRHIVVTGSVQILMNAIFVRVPASRVQELRSLPGVKSVTPLPRVHRHMDQAVQLMGIPDAWNSLGGPAHAGAGVKIGLLAQGRGET